MTLREKQSQFARMVAELIAWIYEQPGYEVTLGYAYRPAFLGIGRLGNRSLHTKRLAIDLNLFIGGVYQTSSVAHLPIGQKWENMGGTWGGRFKNEDGNHYSLREGQ